MVREEATKEAGKRRFAGCGEDATAAAEGCESHLLSSNTLLRFSAHSGSTSPSNTIQWFRCDSPRMFPRMRRRREVKMPSVHSRVEESKEPYNSSLPTA